MPYKVTVERIHAPILVCSERDHQGCFDMHQPDNEVIYQQVTEELELTEIIAATCAIQGSETADKQNLILQKIKLSAIIGNIKDGLINTNELLSELDSLLKLMYTEEE